MESQRSVRVHIKNFGCKTNFFDAFSILGRIKKSFNTELTNLSDSDMVILNSCSVTQDAEKELQKWLKRAKKNGKKVIVTGCLPNLKNIKADLVIGAGRYNEISEEIIKSAILSEEGKNEISENTNEIKLEDLYIKNDVITEDIENADYDSFPRTRAYLKIQEGCNRFCSFCSIPITRGLPRFLPEQKVISKIKELVEKGFKEIVLVGTHLALYGEEGKQREKSFTLGKLIKKISKELHSEKVRIRLSSLSPKEIDDDMLEGLSLGKNIFCPHFHIAVQSGSNKVLKLMRRWHSFEDFLEDSEKLLKIFPDACIGTDIIVGFPGEIEKDFDETISNIKKSQIGHIHVFPFSPRPKTTAMFMKPVPQQEINKRVETLLKIAEEKRKEFFKKFIGKTLEILIEDTTDKIEGTTPNYINVLINTPKILQKGQIIKGEITEIIEEKREIYSTAVVQQQTT